MPRHQDRAENGDQDGGGLFRRRSRCSPRRDGGRGGAPRAAARRAVLPADRQDRRGLQGDGRPGGPPRLRLPLRARGVSDRPPEGRHRLHRAQPQGDRRHGRQDREQEGGGSRQGFDRPGLHGRDRRREACGQDRRRDRLSGDDQGLRRRRRQGHAHRLEQGRGRRRLQLLAQRGQGELRRRSHVHREVHRQSAPHRDPAHRRQARQRHLSRRARMLDPAPQSEGDRGSAVSAARREDAQGDGRAGGRAGQSGRLRFRRHRGVRRRPGQELLLPGDEHASAGRASGDGADHGRGSRRADDPVRGRREAALQASRT